MNFKSQDEFGQSQSKLSRENLKVGAKLHSSACFVAMVADHETDAHFWSNKLQDLNLDL